MKNKLIERAEDFIIAHDITAEIIKDGKIKQGAKLLAAFYESEIEIPIQPVTDEEIEKWERDEAFSSNGKDLTQIQEAIVICYHAGLRVGAKAMRDGEITQTKTDIK